MQNYQNGCFYRKTGTAICPLKGETSGQHANHLHLFATYLHTNIISIYYYMYRGNILFLPLQNQKNINICMFDDLSKTKP